MYLNYNKGHVIPLKYEITALGALIVVNSPVNRICGNRLWNYNTLWWMNCSLEINTPAAPGECFPKAITTIHRKLPNLWRPPESYFRTNWYNFHPDTMAFEWRRQRSGGRFTVVGGWCNESAISIKWLCCEFITLGSVEVQEGEENERAIRGNNNEVEVVGRITSHAHSKC